MSSNVVLDSNLVHEASLAMSKLARDQIQIRYAEIRAANILEGINLAVISKDHLGEIRDLMCSKLSILDSRIWSGHGTYTLKSGLLFFRGKDLISPLLYL